MDKDKSKQQEESPEETEEESEGPQSSGGEGVTVSEDYQKKAHHVTHKATQHELDHLRSKMHGREDDLRKEKMKKEKSEDDGKGFSSADMPSID